MVLYYHAILPEHRARLAHQMDILLRSATPLAPGSQERLHPGVRYAAVTFDDGYLSAVQNAIPELAQRNIPSTIFIVTERLGQDADWQTEDPGTPRYRLASLEQLRQLPSDLVTIGSHSLTHPMLTAIDSEQARHEIFESRARAEELFGRSVALFSFPYGAFNPQLVDLCREAGYQRAFTTSARFAFTHPHEFLTGRIAVDPTDWALEFRLKLLGAYCWLPVVQRWKRRLQPFRGLNAISHEYPKRQRARGIPAALGK